MEFPSQEKTINGTTYKVTQLQMRKWFELEALVLKNFGQSISLFLSSQTIKDRDAQDLAIGQALRMITESADPDVHETLLKLLSQSASIEGTSLTTNYNSWWPMHIKDIPAFLFFALGVQFKDFFDGLMSLDENMMKTSKQE